MVDSNEPEYKQLLHIDRSRLLEMMETQPLRFMWAIEQSAQADLEVRNKTLALDIADADVYSRLKDTTGSNGKALSEAAIKQMLPADPVHAEAYNALTQAKSEARILSGVVDSFAQRKTMLAKITERENMSYNADPSRKSSTNELGENAGEAMAASFQRRG